MTKAKKEELQPRITQVVPKGPRIEKRQSDNPIPDMGGFDASDFMVSEGGDSGANSFFRAVITDLLSQENTGSKTEYVNLRETFAGAKLQYLGSFCNMPTLAVFLKQLETKRISLQRKGRIELVRALEMRAQEIQREIQQKAAGGILGGPR